MRLIRTCLLVLIAGLCAAASATPAVLIVRLKPEKGALGLDVPICDYVANEVQAGGKLVPIVWGLSDPIYRAAVEEGKIKSGDETPTINEATSVAGKLRCEYVIAVDLRGGSGEILGAAALYKSGRLLWKDPNVDLGPALAHLRDRLKKKQITQEEYDNSVLRANFRASAIQVSSKFGLEDTARSMARTWAEMMDSGPLLSLAKQTVKPTPDPGQGQIPHNPETGNPPTKPIADSKWKTDVASALKAGDTNLAVSILRDAVDALPLEVDRRMSLVKTLLQFGEPSVAAKEARRAAELLPEHLEFRAMAGRAWIQAGNVDEAQSDLNEAVMRAPDSPETRLLLAEVSIAKGEFSAAIEHLDKAITVAPTGDAYYLRALARAMAGDVNLAEADMKKASDTGLSQDPQEAEARYGLVAEMFDDGLSSIGNDIRSLHARAQVQRQDKEVRGVYDDLAKRVSGRSRFISSLPVPQGHELSHNRRVLAYKLLSQCLTDLASYLKDGNEDVLVESRINLGEALKQGVSARQRFKDEQQGAKKSDAKSG